MNSSATLTGCDDIIKRLREAIAEHPLSPIHGYADNIAALLDRLDAAEAENERLRAALDIARDYVATNVAYLRERYRDREQFGRVHEAEGDLAAIDAARAAEQPESAE